MLFMLFLSYYVPLYTVNVDINPSIAFDVNIYKKITTVKGLNSEGENLIKKLHLEGLSLDESLPQIIYAAKDEYLADDAVVLISITPLLNQNSEEMAIRSNEIVSEASEQNDLHFTFDVNVIDKELKEEADALGISPGRLKPIYELRTLNEDSVQSISEATTWSMKEIHNTINTERVLDGSIHGKQEEPLKESELPVQQKREVQSEMREDIKILHTK